MARRKYDKAEKAIWLKGYFYAFRKMKKSKSKTQYSTSKYELPQKSVKEEKPKYLLMQNQVIKPKHKFVPPPEPPDLHKFLAFNDNGDMFNVFAYGETREKALKYAREKLKRDPERPCWGVHITESKANEEEYFRNVSVSERHGISDNWSFHYKDRDEKWRKMYPDLSKPVDGTGEGEFPRPKK